MKNAMFIGVLLLQSMILNAQINKFDLSTYKLPDITQHVLNAQLNLGGDQTGNSNNEDINTLQKNNELNFNGDVDVLYSFFRNSQKLQSWEYIKGSFKPEISSRKTDIRAEYPVWNNPGTYSMQDYISDNKDNSWEGQINLSSANKIYFKKKWFFEPAFSFHGNYTYDNSLWTDVQGVNSNSTSQSDAHITSITSDISLGIGYGRIEQVQDARLAVYILNDLDKNHRLKRTPDDQEIIKFARLISAVKYKRIFDSRIKKMEEIKAVDSFLQANNLISSADAEYFTLVNDNWDYAYGPQRLSGISISFGVLPGIDYMKMRDEDKSTSVDTSNIPVTSENSLITTTNNKTIYAFVNFEYEKPLNLYWQTSTWANLDYGLLSYKNDTDKINGSQIKAGIGQNIGYYPNSRTSIKMGLNIQYDQMFEKSKNKHFDLSPALAINISHYFSYKLSLSLNYSLSYGYEHSYSIFFPDQYPVNKNFYQNLSLGLIYNIL